MENINILIAEDYPGDIEAYTDAIEEFNEENQKVQIKAVIQKNKDSALASLKENSYDTVFIDLNLDSESLGKDYAEGNELVDFIFENVRYPIFVFTGKENEHIKTLSDTNPLIHLNLKGGDKETLDLFNEMKDIYLTGITKILSNNGQLDKYLNNIFWNHLSSTLPHWLKINNGTIPIEKMISRYTLTHLYEYMEINDSSQKEFYDPAEAYICPPIKKDFSAGDIVQFNDQSFKLLITPSCTIANDGQAFQFIDIIDLYTKDDVLEKIEKVNTEKEKQNKLLAEKEKLGDDDFNNKYTKNQNSITKAESALKGLITSYIANTKGFSYHYLPAFLDFKHSLVNFQQVKTYKKDEVNRLKPQMTVSVQFFKDIQARFATFYARQGSPDYNKKFIANEMMQELLN